MPYRSMHIVAASGNTLLQSAPSEISEERVNTRSSVGCFQRDDRRRRFCGGVA